MLLLKKQREHIISTRAWINYSFVIIVLKLPFNYRIAIWQGLANLITWFSSCCSLASVLLNKFNGRHLAIYCIQLMQELAIKTMNLSVMK